MLNTEFLSAAASRLDSFAARLSAFAFVGRSASGERRNGADAVDSMACLLVKDGC